MHSRDWRSCWGEAEAHRSGLAQNQIAGLPDCMMPVFYLSRLCKLFIILPGRYLLGLFVLWALLSPVANADQPSYPVTINTAGGCRVVYHLELAATPKARNRGLMYRSEMRADAGMLFVWPDEVERSFWMRNTSISLDILFFSSDKKLVSIHERTEPFSETSLLSGRPAQYVVELNAGQARLQGLTEGSYLVFPVELLRRLQ